MATDRYLSVAREGWPFIFIAATAAAVIQRYHGLDWAAPLWLAALFFAVLFRDPERAMSGGALEVLSPVDGVVTAVETGQDPYLDRAAVVVKISTSLLGSYATRSPVEGKVMQRWYEPVRRQGTVGQAHGIWLQTDEGDNVVLAMDPNLRLMQARCGAQPGERLGQGHRCGFIPFGARVVVFLPASSRINVAPGARLKAGMDAIAKLVHK